jgi:hypothetical protein
MVQLYYERHAFLARTRGCRSIPGAVIIKRVFVALLIGCTLLMKKFCLGLDRFARVAVRSPCTAVIDCFVQRHSRDAIAAARHVVWDESIKLVPSQHSHPVAQLTRAQAIRTIDDYAQRLSAPVYAVSTSTREDRVGWSGDRLYHTAKDLQQPSRVDRHNTKEVTAYIDVDYYVTKDKMFAQTGVKAIYTIVPDRVAGQGPDSYWYIDDRGIYHEEICGGARYSHPVWNYGNDIVMAENYLSCTLYDLHLVPGPANRAVVIACPSYTVWLPPFLMRRCFTYPTMQRVPVSVSSTGAVALTVARDREVHISIRRSEATGHSVTIPLPVYAAVRDHVLTTKVPGVAGINNVLERCGKNLPVEDVYALAAYLQAPAELTEPVNYTRSVDSDNPGKAFATLVAEPIVPPAAAATMHDANTDASVQKRVLDVRNTVKPPQEYYGYASEFNAFLFPPGTPHLIPHSREEAILRLAKTSDKFCAYLRNESAIKSDKLEDVQAFLKREVTPGAAAKGQPSRLIFPVEQETLIRTMRFIGPMKDYELNNMRNGVGFSCVGLTPAETGERVQAFARGVTCIDQTDFSKMDGTHSEFTNNNYLYVYRCAFEKQHHKDIREAFARNYNRKVALPRTELGRPKRKKFNSEQMNMSGKGDTTNQNHWPNGFVDYCALRNGGVSPAEAYKRIGPKFGDDGLGDGAFDRVAVAGALGFTVTSDVVPSNAPVSFLSRIFPVPRDSPMSIVEPLRALSKIPVSTATKGKAFLTTDLANRVAGYLASDRDTPLVADYCNALTRIYGLRPDLANIDRDMAYRIEAGAYPYDAQFEGECVAVIAQRLGVTATEVYLAIKELRAVKRKEDLGKIRLVEATRLARGLLAVGEPDHRDP